MDSLMDNAVAVNTAKLPPKQLAKHCIKPGEALNPKGRPKGSRNKVSEAFLQDMHDIWQRRGMQVLEEIATKEPGKLLAAMVQVLPKDFQLSVDTDQVNWVINAQPQLSESDWRKQNNLPEPDET